MTHWFKTAAVAFTATLLAIKAGFDVHDKRQERKAKKEAKKQLEENADSKEN